MLTMCIREASSNSILQIVWCPTDNEKSDSIFIEVSTMYDIYTSSTPKGEKVLSAGDSELDELHAVHL